MTDYATAEQVAWLRARIDEDEAIATAATQGRWLWHSWGQYETSDELSLRAAVGDEPPDRMKVVLEAWSAYSDGDGIEAGEADKAFIVRFQPERALAHCRLMRAILDAGDQLPFVAVGCETAWLESQVCSVYETAVAAMLEMYGWQGAAATTEEGGDDRR